MSQLRGRLATGGRIHPAEIDILPTASISRGTVATIPADELNLGTPSDVGNIGRSRESKPITSQEMRLSKIIDNPSMSQQLTNGDMEDEDGKFQGDLRQFVRQHFHKMECSRFVPKPDQKVKSIKDIRCHCGSVLMDHAGMSLSNRQVTSMTEQFLIPKELQRIFRRESLHSPAPERMPSLSWSPDHLRKTVTCSYGKIDFINVEHVGGKKPAKYIRMCADDSVDDVFEVMQSYWRIMEPTVPNLVISVVGGAKNFKLDGRMRTTFESGLIKTAKTTSAWLISSGFNMGVMKAVGQAVRQGQSFCWDNGHMMHVLRCIGIAPWGYVRHRRNLESQDGEGKFCAQYRTSNVILHGEPVPLNADHTHFIFVDDGYRNRYGGVAAMRSKIEQKISQPESEGGLGIPVVLVVVEGGTDAIADARSSLEHKIPVVVCSGTGRAANILSYAYSHTKTVSGTGVQKMSEKHTMKLRDKIFDAYGASWKEQEIENKTDAILESVVICCQNTHLMTVFNMNKADELDLAILSVLLKTQSGANEQQRLSQLKLALTWNRVDIAQEEIFREDVLWRHGSLDGVLTQAIIKDKVKFIQLILEQGVIMKEFLTFDRLCYLYSKVPQHHYIYKMLYKLTGKNDLSVYTVADLLSKLLDRFDKSKTLIMDLDDSDDTCMDEPGNATFVHPYKHLLIYSVLLNRQSLAKFCWEMGDEPVTSAIAVTRLYTAISRHITRDESGLRDTIIMCKQEFEQLGTSVLNECHQSDPSKAQMIVERKSPTWQEMTSLQIASASNDMMYMSTEACQNSVLTCWKQGILAGYKQSFLCMLFPFLILCSMEFANVGRKPLTWYQKLGTFYTSPLSKFCHGTFLYLVFLLVHSYMVLVDYQPDRVTPLEIFCCIWVFTFLVDKIHTFVNFPSPTFVSKIRDWYGVISWIEALNYILCFIGFLLHWLGYYNATKVLYCLNSVIFFMVVTKAYMASASIGPKLIMIQRMLGELRLFVCVLMVFLLAYGIASQGLLYHERSPSWSILKDVLYFPYWQLYGEIFFEAIAADGEGNSLSNGTACVAGERDCLTFHWMVPFILAGYLMVGNILLLNLLIAIFSNVFQQVEKNSIEIWKYNMYLLVMEFDNKTLLVPPFSILHHMCLVVIWVYRRLCMDKSRSKQILGRRHLEYLQLFEKEMMMNYLRRKRASELMNTETRIEQLEKRVDMLTKLIEEEVITDQQADGGMSFASTVVMTTEGPQRVTSHVSSLDMSRPWPTVHDILSVKDAVLATPIPSEYYGKNKPAPMVRSNTGAALTIPKMPPRTKSSPNLIPGAPVGRQGAKTTDDVISSHDVTSSYLTDRDANKNVGKLEESITEDNTEENLHEDGEKVGDDLMTRLLDREKQRKKEEKEARKQRKKAKKEEKRQLKEAMKLKENTMSDMNDVNRPGGEVQPDDLGVDETSQLEDSGRSRPLVTFNLDNDRPEVHRHSSIIPMVTFNRGVSSRPTTAPVRSLEIISQANSNVAEGDRQHDPDNSRNAW